MPERAPEPSPQERPSLLDRLFFWTFAGLLILGALKVERDIEA